MLLSLRISYTWEDRDMAEEHGARPTPEEMRDQSKRKIFSGTCQDPIHGIESRKQWQVTSEVTVTVPGWPKAKLLWFRAMFTQQGVQSSSGRYLVCTLHLPGTLCNVVTSIRLLNVALLRVMDPGEAKRALYKSPKLPAVNDLRKFTE